MQNYIPEPEDRLDYMGESFDVISDSLTSLDTSIALFASEVLTYTTILSANIPVLESDVIFLTPTFNHMGGYVSSTTTNVNTLSSNLTSLSSTYTNTVPSLSTATTIVGTMSGQFRDVRFFTTTGTWTNPSPNSPRRVYVRLVGGGGGGSSGRTGNFTTVGANAEWHGGAGGGGAGVVEFWTLTNQLGASLPVTVGAGGIGGINNTLNSVVGNSIGNNGGNSSFASEIALGGSGVGDIMFNAIYKHGVRTATGTSDGSALLAIPTGGGLGGHVIYTGGALPGGGSYATSSPTYGGIQAYSSVYGAILGGAGGIGYIPTERAGAIGNHARGTGTGGGGGYAIKAGFDGGTPVAGRGGDGGGYGSGGGGGGAGTVGTATGGTGGTGGHGYALIITY